ncbi:MAG: diguanylate cyclase [Alistipes sp.]|nr:diguanylate cyclase [Alistipes sp.]
MIPKLIGVCLSTIHEEDRFNFVKELNGQAVKKGFRLMIFNSCSDLYEHDNADNDGAASVFRLIPYEKLDAIIIFSNFICTESIVRMIIDNSLRHNIPTISIDKQYEGCFNFSFAYADIFERLVHHVINEHGARELFLITGAKDNPFSDARTNAFKNVLEECGIPFSQNNVGYGNFWDGPTLDLMKQWFEIEKRSLPDAIICANDSMAITVSGYLQQQGYSIPEDCIITGFDGIEQAHYHLPHITTCRQNYNEMSRLILDTIEAVERGESVPAERTVGFEMILSQSCGCKCASNARINPIVQTLIDRLRLSTERQDMICTIQSSISKMNDINELPPILIDKFRLHTNIFAMNSDIFDSPDYGTFHKGEQSFGENVDIIYNRYFWRDFEQGTLPAAELIPRYDLITEREDPIVICTIHFIDMVMGYSVFQPEINLDEYRKMHTLMSAICASLGNFHGRIQIRRINEQLLRANNELHHMSQRDFMTGLYNRRGFFEIFSSRMDNAGQKSAAVVVISADLDELKYINDTFGHQEGDSAITTVGRALMSSSVQEEICARFGGDEFCVAAIIPADDAGEYFAEFKSRFLGFLNNYNKKSDKPYIVRASIGCSVKMIGEYDGLDDMIRIADENMYCDKSEHKRK